MYDGSSIFGKRLVLVMAVACVLIVSGFAYLYFSGLGVAPAPRRNLVGVISVEGSIVSSKDAWEVEAAINNAVHNSSIKAAVVRIDSPGGYSHLIEEIYLDLVKLGEKKPVVASVVTALSGGYYVAVACDYIYASPTSMLGNVGVIGVGPDMLLPSEVTLESGPYKATGFSPILFPFNLSRALENFAGAVEGGRGDRLRLSQKELKRGMIYLGVEAENFGLIDGLASLQGAIERAASEAGLTQYGVVDVQPKWSSSGVSSYSNETLLQWRDITVDALNRINPPPSVYYLYLPRGAYTRTQFPDNVTEGNVTRPQVFGKGQVIVDLSHGNMVSHWVFDVLSAELAPRGVSLGYGTTWEEVEGGLDYASCLIVAAPTEAYTYDEYKTIEAFVNKGRLLLLFYDPAYEFIQYPYLAEPVNSLSKRYGFSFGNGYLYNEDENYGLYRNIYVRDFEESSLTHDIETLVFFTATHLHPTDRDAAITSPDTWSTVAERQRRYSVVSVLDRRNGTVAAFGDLTFLMEPYCYLEDNYQLLMNIVLAIAEIEIPANEE